MDASSLFSFNRRISSVLTGYFVKTPLRPNHVTTLALISGFIAAYFMSYGTRPAMLLGAFFMHAAIVFDDCDGELARRKDLRSRFGMWYDFTADLAVDLALWTGLALGAVNRGATPGVFAVAWLAGAGSLINFLRVIRQRKGLNSWADEKPFQSSNFVSKWLDVLSRDGDPSLLLWVLAAVGDPWLCLALGCFYIHLLWIYSLLASVSARATISSKN
ncbi:MAG: CDP-alcohol phosphatidyltransferase family protein [Candidatus Omnitrophica bacterium]|nr:CDP-alcohol phosphatidyltransferase family protein [Candidatus Omnitrophota bacterium]